MESRPAISSRTPAAWRQGRLPAPGVVAGLVILAAVAVQLFQVDHRLDLGNGDFYLRNAKAYAGGTLAHSRYSPGVGLFLSPIARLAGNDYRLLTFLSELTMVAVSLAALVVLHRLLRVYLAPWTAVALLAAFALGQSAATFLSGVEAEPLALLLVSGCLLALINRWPWWAVGLGGLAVGVRVALAPFIGVVFLLLLLRHRRAGAAGLVAVLAAGVAHLASGPTVDQSYVGIAGAVYGENGHGASGVLSRVASQVVIRAKNYLRIGIPRLVVPFRLLASPAGLLVSAIVLAAIVFGLIRLRQDRGQTEAAPEPWVLDAACLAGLATLAFLLVWPIRAAESTRLLIPIAFLPLVGLGRSLEDLVRAGTTRRPVRIGWALVAALVALNVASTAPVLAAHRRRPATERRFFAVHEEASRLVWSGPVVSKKPAFTELTTRRLAYSYPAGESVADLEQLSRRTAACTFVLDEVFGGLPDSTVEWLRSRQNGVIAAKGATSIVTIWAPWCPGPG